MSPTKATSNTTVPTQLLQTNAHSYAYRRFGSGSGLPLLFLQHFTGTLDNWDPAVTDPLASGREVILFDNAGVGRSTGEVPRRPLESRRVTSSGIPSVEWLHFRWCRTGRRSSAG
jgi:pimeloyl-ACP methyl ester carboxylesterase